MKTKELIEALQKEDPSGELEVVAGGTPIYFVEQQPAYYDGPLHVLLHDESKRGKCYSINGYKITRKGNKIKLHLMDLPSVICNNPDIPIDISEVKDSTFYGELYSKRVERLRKFFKDEPSIELPVTTIPEDRKENG